MKHSPQSGFSLVELLVALTVTMIVSGAVYGLLASGQGAFRKEPALSDRQANIRSAMDQIVTDLTGAGAAMPPYTQVFTPGLDGPAGGPNGLAAGVLTDELEILTDTSGIAPQPVCAVTNTTVDIAEAVFPITKDQSFTIFVDGNRWTVRVASADAAPVAGAACPSGQPAQMRITFAGGSPLNVGGGLCAGAPAGIQWTADDLPPGGCTPVMVSGAHLVHYRIRPDADGVPNLQRQTSDNWGVWQPVFPGIEDLQVRYQDGPSSLLAPPNDFVLVPQVLQNPAAHAAGELDKLVRRVEVTMSARTVAGNLTGQVTSAGAGSATRGTLQTITSMRPALETMSIAGLPPPYPRRF